MDKYIEAEKRLAELLGGTELRYGSMGWWEGKIDGELVDFADWCRDDAAAFRLMVEHEICLEWDSNRVFALHIDSCVVWVRVKSAYADHPDKETAVRYAIVQAVIKKLEADHG